MNAGFYKQDGIELLYGPNFVINTDYELRSDTHGAHTYPIDGWYWFDSDDEAYGFFGIQKPDVPTQTGFPWDIEWPEQPK